MDSTALPHYKKIDDTDLAFFRSVIGDAYVITSHEGLEKYAKDETEDLRFYPEVVLKPSCTEEISRVMKYCNEHLIPVSPRAAGTGLSANSLCIYGGVMLTIERLNKIINIDEKNLQVITEPGVITEHLQNTVKEKGLYYPPDPSSRGSSFIGGNVACNSGGPRAVKYGVVKDFVLNLEVVLASGEVIWTGTGGVERHRQFYDGQVAGTRGLSFSRGRSGTWFLHRAAWGGKCSSRDCRRQGAGHPRFSNRRFICRSSTSFGNRLSRRRTRIGNHPSFTGAEGRHSRAAQTSAATCLADVGFDEQSFARARWSD